MTDLTGKFVNLQDILAAQHDETQLTLNAILTALGGAPPEPDATLADVVAAQGLTNSKLDSIISLLTAGNDAQAAFHTLALGYMDAIATATLDTNAYLRGTFDIRFQSIFLAVNRQLLLTQALSCECESMRPAIEAPLDTTLVELNSDHCKRVQFMLENWGNGVASVANTVSSGIALTSAAAGVLLAAGIIPGVNLVSIPAGLLAAIVALAGTAASIRLNKLAAFFSTYDTQLRNMFYNSLSAATAKANWDAFIDSKLSFLGDGDLVIWLKLMGWSGIFNALYDDTNVWDTSPYDGDDCGEFNIDCQQYTAIEIAYTTTIPSSGTLYGIADDIDGFAKFDSVTTSSGIIVTRDPESYYSGNLEGWTFRVISGSAQMVWRDVNPNEMVGFNTTGMMNSGDSPFVMPITNHWYIDDNATGVEPFVVLLCPPE